MAVYAKFAGPRPQAGNGGGGLAISGLSLDILKMESWTHMGRTANIIIKDVINVCKNNFHRLRL